MLNRARRVRVIIGGSNRQYSRQWAALEQFADCMPIRRTLGGRQFNLTIIDTDAARQVVAAVGARIAREQPRWLNEEDFPNAE